MISILRIGWARAQSLFDVSLDYCDGAGNTLALQVDAGVPKHICYTLANHATAPITLAISFVDGVYTNDTLHNKACLSANDTQQFGKYVSDYDAQIIIQPGESIQKQAVLQYPLDSKWVYNGCIVYTVLQEPVQTLVSDQYINILMRKAKFIDVTVQGSGQKAWYTWSDAAQKIQSYTKSLLSGWVSDASKDNKIILDTMSYITMLIFVMICIVVGWYIATKKKNHIHRSKSSHPKANK